MFDLTRWLVLLFLLTVSCAQPPLIIDGDLNPARFQAVVDRASGASGLSVLTPLSAELMSRAQLHATLKQDVDANKLNSEQQAAEAAMGWEAFPINLGLDFLSRMTMGLYRTNQRTIYLINELPRGEDGSYYLSTWGELGDEITLAHEVIHALQHQHYPHLFEPNALSTRHTDAATALQAAIEGTATYGAANTLGFLGGPRPPDQVLVDSSRQGAESDETPLVYDRVSFPYTYGYRMAFYEGTELLETPPASTEQVIHFEEDGERPSFLAIDLSPLNPIFQTHTCRALWEDTMGELGISLWMQSLNPTIDASVAQGWDGDRWMVLACAFRKEIAWLTSWDTDQDAREFEEAMASISESLLARHSVESPWVSSREGREVVVVSRGLPLTASRSKNWSAESE